MTAGRAQHATPLARPVDLSRAWNASDAELAVRLHPTYAAALARLPEGEVVLRGLPFVLGRRDGTRRWLVVGGAGGADDQSELDVDLGVALDASSRATYLVVAHFSDSWRDPSGGRPDGRPVGWVEPAGEALARYEITLASGASRTTEIRRRFEIDDGIIGWGYLPFAAVAHRFDEPVDWRGPHERQGSGRYAPAGHAGPLTILPGSWGGGQTGVSDFVPTVDDDIAYWLHAIPLDAADPPSRLRISSLGDGRPGTAVVVAGLTLFSGRSHPLRLEPRRQLLVRGAGACLPATDLGVSIRAMAAAPDDRSADGGTGVIGWGSMAGEADPDGGGQQRPDALIVDVATTADARLRFGEWELGVARLDEPGADAASPDRSVIVTPLPARDVRVAVRVTADGEATASRVRFVDHHGRYLPPLAHRTEVNPGLYEDSGADVLLGDAVYAYVPGEFEIDLPRGGVTVEVVKGFDHRPVRTELTVDAATSRLDLALDRVIDLRRDGWVSSDSHVHFVSPSTALLQAAAEDVAFVHLLSTQWGDHFTSVTDIPWGGQRDPSGRHEVIVGTENRHNLLGHLALLGGRRPVLPQASGGSPEGHLGGPTTDLLGEWAERCRAEGGLVVGAHFPLPYAEVAAAILQGSIDAVEMQTFAPGLDTPSILEWYRFLSAGHRLPVLGGTDKMTATVPVGAVRTYARLDAGAPRTFDSWARAVRAGRTFATSGPVIGLSVDGHEPGDVVALPSGGGRVEVRASARAAQSVITSVEIVLDGRVVADTTADASDDLSVEASVEIRHGSWIAARSRSADQIASAFFTSMASHTSPVYVDVGGRGAFSADAAAGILPIVEGTALWLETIAAVADPERRRRMVERISESGAALRERIQIARREER